MRVLVDTSVWSLALRRDVPPDIAEIEGLRRALDDGDLVFTTGLVLQELLQGFQGPRARQCIVDDFSALPLLAPSRADHIEAASLRNTCRRRGIQIGTIDALIAQLCIHHELVLLTTDADFSHMADACSLELWHP